MPELSTQFSGYELPTNAMASTQGGTRGRVTAQHVDRKHVNWQVARGDVRVKKIRELKLEE